MAKSKSKASRCRAKEKAEERGREAERIHILRLSKEACRKPGKLEKKLKACQEKACGRKLKAKLSMQAKRSGEEGHGEPPPDRLGRPDLLPGDIHPYGHGEEEEELHEDSSRESSSPSSDGLMSRFGQSVIAGLEKTANLLGGDGLVRGGPAALGEREASNENGVHYYLKQEIAAAREAVGNLDKAVSKATSFREKSSMTLEEAHRALSRLQQAVETEKAADLVAIACEIKVATRTALTLVEVYGSKGKLGQMASMVMRKQIHSKFDAVTERLKHFLPPPRMVTDEGSSTSSLTRGSRPLQPTNSGKLAVKADRPLGSRSIGGYTFSHAATPGGGTVIRQDKHGKHGRIYSVCYVPATGLTFNCVCLWWSAGQLLEFYSESSESTTAFEVKDPSLTVTCLGVDAEGNVWSGHVKGLVRVKKKQHWELVIEDQGPPTPVRVITFDDKNQAWIGDDFGGVRVLKYDQDNSKLVVVTSLVHRRSLEEKPVEKGKDASMSKSTVHARQYWYKAASTGVGASASKRAQGPARCIYVSGTRAWVGGGRTDGWLTLWSTETYQQIDLWEGATFGSCNVLSPIRWGQQSNAPGPISKSFSMPTEGDALAPLVQGQTPRSAGSSSWRIMTGHENGQVLLWQPGSDRLLPLLRIGDPSSAIRGMTVFENYNLVVLAHANGELALTIRAHKSNCSVMIGYENTCVTASNLGTIRIWQAKDLVAEAEGQGLLTNRGMDRAASGEPPSQYSVAPHLLSQTNSMKDSFASMAREGSVKRSLSHENLMSFRERENSDHMLVLVLVMLELVLVVIEIELLVRVVIELELVVIEIACVLVVLKLELVVIEIAFVLVVPKLVRVVIEIVLVVIEIAFVLVVPKLVRVVIELELVVIEIAFVLVVPKLVRVVIELELVVIEIAFVLVVPKLVRVVIELAFMLVVPKLVRVVIELVLVVIEIAFMLVVPKLVRVVIELVLIVIEIAFVLVVLKLVRVVIVIELVLNLLLVLVLELVLVVIEHIHISVSSCWHVPTRPGLWPSVS
eukprot:gene18693-25214_t